MARAAPRLRFFLDNNVPDSIGSYLQRRGHSVQRQRFHIPVNSPDQVVAMTAMQAERILVTLDKDFNSQRFQQERFDRLSLLFLNGPSYLLLAAVKNEMDTIEFRAASRKGARRLVVHLKPGQIRFRD
jgi:predicted nuclease of predicted toxin-antitoxin system